MANGSFELKIVRRQVPWNTVGFPDSLRGGGMVTNVEATLTNGVFKPDQPVSLADDTRVRLTIEPIEDWSATNARAAWQAIEARLRQRPINGGGVRYTRDQLHERRWYQRLPDCSVSWKRLVSV
jgi:predicted DNA-binding antitoxin AbrB/MazE fold protein